MPLPLLPAVSLGSYPQPDWLVDRARLAERLPPRVRAREIWRVTEPLLEGAQDDAAVLAIRDMERAGLHVVTDGEVRRESYSNHFAQALDGLDLDRPAEVVGRTGRATPVPRVVGPIRRRASVEGRGAAVLRAGTERQTKVTLPGPYTLSRQAKDEHYGDPEALAMAFAAAVNEEALELRAAGIDVVQIDEPWMEQFPDGAREYGIRALDRALLGVDGETVVHVCFGYAAVVPDKPHAYAILPRLADCAARGISIEAAQPRLDLGVLREVGGKTVLLGVLDLGAEAVETAEEVAGRLRAGLAHVPAERLVAAPDCGMKYLPRERAFGKLRAMAEGAAIVRRELEG